MSGIFRYFSALFEKKNSSFNEKSSHDDEVTDDIWWQIFLRLLTQDSEHSIGFSKFFWKHGKPDPNFQDANIKFFCTLSAFLSFQGTPAKK